MVLFDSPVEACIVDCGGDAAGDEAQKCDIAFRVSVAASALKIDYSDEAATSNHRHGKFTANCVESAEVSFVGADIAYVYGLAAFGCGTGEAFAEFNAEGANELFAVADRVAHPEAFVAIAVEKNGEDIETNDAMDDICDVIENLIEIECGGGGVGDFEQKVEKVCALFKADIPVGSFSHQ